MDTADLKKAAVIGAGDMGHGIAQLALMAGCEVVLCDISDEAVERGKSRICASLEKLASKGKIDPKILQEALTGKLVCSTVIAEAVKDVQFIAEAVPERMDIKLNALKAASEAAPKDAVIATNTSTMSITALAQAVIYPERFIGMHYFNPAVLMPLVEIIYGEKTSEETAAFARAYAEKIKKTAVIAYKDTPGFIANRIVAPVVVYNGLLLDERSFTPADIDLSMQKDGLAMGPMELADYTGVDVTSACQDYYHEHLHPDYAPSETAKELLAAGHLGKKRGQGYYTWPQSGRPALDSALYTGNYDPDVPNFIQANEALKLYEEGVCSLTDADAAMRLGYRMKEPVRFLLDKDPEQVSAVLDGIAERFRKEIFRPAELLRSGEYKAIYEKELREKEE